MFTGQIEFRLRSDIDDRTVEILSVSVFTDSSGGEWKVAPGELVNGASIPAFFWRFIGSPFVGRYRRAAVFHDVHCVWKTEDSEAVHRMFWEAMIADDVQPWRAWAMWFAVRFFGPRFKAANPSRYSIRYEADQRGFQRSQAAKIDRP